MMLAWKRTGSLSPGTARLSAFHKRNIVQTIARLPGYFYYMNKKYIRSVADIYFEGELPSRENFLAGDDLPVFTS